MATKTSAPPLLWINHDINNRKALPYRHAVFTHVQSSYKRWKRQEDAQILRNSAKIPHLRPPGTQLIAAKQPGIRPTDAAQEVNDEAFPIDDIEDSFEFADELEVVSAQVSPLTMLRRGNSDPFQAFAIPIDALVTHAMSYTKDLYFPGVFKDANNPQVRNATDRDYAEVVSFLHDESTAYAHLARIAAAMPKSESNTSVVSQSLVFRTKGIAALRRRLLNKDNVQDQRTYDSILLLLAAENYDENFEAALFHAGMIAHLLKTSKVAVSEWFVFKVVYNDVQRSCLSLSRTVFDHEVWVPQRFEPLYQRATKPMPDNVMFEACEKEIDDSIVDPVMREMMTHLHHLNSVFRLSYQNQDFANRQTILYMRCRVVVVLGRLVNHYLDSVSVMENGDWRRPDLVRAARVEAYTSLSQIFLLRCKGKLDTFHIGDKVAIFSANPRILRRVQELLEQDEWNTEQQYARMKLSALFAGAWAEQAKAATTDKTADSGWFNVRLAAQAARMGLQSWREVRDALLGFSYSDFLEPNGARWFWKTMIIEAGRLDKIGRAHV